MTPLQGEISRSMAWKHLLREAVKEMGLTGLQYIVKETFDCFLSGLSDNQCRDMCRRLLLCEDTTEKERQQLLTILYER